MSGAHAIARRKFAAVQVAAQALLARGANGAIFGSHWTSDGGFTNARTEGFIDVWRLVSLNVDCTAGFGGALFKAKRNAREQGVASGELVLSLHACHAVGEAGACIDQAAAPKFFTQLTALERWAAGVRSLREPRHPLTLTNHPNGWHLTAGFHRLYPGRAQASYTFDGPGDEVPGAPAAANDTAF